MPFLQDWTAGGVAWDSIASQFTSVHLSAAEYPQWRHDGLASVRTGACSILHELLLRCTQGVTTDDRSAVHDLLAQVQHHATPTMWRLLRALLPRRWLMRLRNQVEHILFDLTGTLSSHGRCSWLC